MQKNQQFCVEHDPQASLPPILGEVANSVNGPNVFQQFAEAIVGDMDRVFQWLSTYSRFKAEISPEFTDASTSFLKLMSQDLLAALRGAGLAFRTVIPMNNVIVFTLFILIM